jgi:prolyl-tRNA synthetase
MKAEFIGESGKPKPLVMGCYGIGVSRIVAAAIEQGHDDRGITFPASIAPFELVITPIGYDKNNDVKNLADSIYTQLLDLGCDVILDDRGIRPGIMFSEMELIGIPHRLTISERLIEENKVEYKNRKSKDLVLVDNNRLTDFLNNLIKIN